MVKLIFLILCLIFNSCGKDSTGTVKDQGTVSGYITNALDGSAISGASIYVVGDRSYTEASSAATGDYTMNNVLEGTHSVQVDASGYVSQTLSLSYGTDLSLTGYNVSLFTSAFAAGNFIIILSWDSNPKDLDAHLWVPEDNNNPIICVQRRVAYDLNLAGNGGLDGNLTAEPWAILDVDDKDGNGPETTRIVKNGDAPNCTGNDYRYYVHNFGGAPTAELTASNAIVRVYKENTLLKEYNVPTSGTGAYWHVFDMDSSGSITDVNTIQSAAPAAP